MFYGSAPLLIRSLLGIKEQGIVYDESKEALLHACKQNGAQNGDREAAVDAEIARVNKLPAHSSYATHRMKVLNKLRHLLSIKRTTSQDEELELLFASLSI
ncbi:uncharacterized protein LOC112875666 isoform X2 [Panicum hallii]|uniref:uncharacterized protein LOC112875666 isoform X2 n=1 Tax=Panicum hallii TaxID=206008 RepID=UPI000DF4D4F5|nr:uncharacterized protein LOC112875666 isoform X2 [Panicum hallii]